MDKGKRQLCSGNPEGSSIDHLLPEEMLGLIGGAAKDKHQGEGSSCGEENRALLIETSTGNASRGGEPQTNGGCNKQPVDTRQRVVGESIVREEDVQERKSQEGDDPTDEDHWKLELKKMWLEAGGSWASEAGVEKKEQTSGEDEKRCGQGSGSKRKSGLPDKEAGEGGSNRNQKTKLSMEDLPPLPNPPPDMPRLWRYHIVTILRGKEVRLVIQKRLTLSDVSEHLCRVSIPMGQIVDSEFLRKEERAFLDASKEKDVRVFCYDYPEKDIGEMVLKLRLLVLQKKNKVQSGKSGGTDGGKPPRPKPSLMYVLRSGWSQFVRDNKLNLHDLIQIWSFRLDSDSVRDELCLALIVLPCNKLERERGRVKKESPD